jgi:hypothetical protein
LDFFSLNTITSTLLVSPGRVEARCGVFGRAHHRPTTFALRITKTISTKADYLVLESSVGSSSFQTVQTSQAVVVCVCFLVPSWVGSANASPTSRSTVAPRGLKFLGNSN